MLQHQPSNLTWHTGAVTREDRQRLLGQKGVTLWLTGLSGSGKSTIGVLVEQMLIARGRLAYRLDGDNIRHGLNKNLSFSPEDRAENIRRIGEVAKLFTDAGVIVIVSFISPYRRDREAVRALMPPGDFVEVHVHASLEAAERRDPKGLYKKARAGEIKGFTGIDDPYEPPENAEIVIDTEATQPDDAAKEIIAYLEGPGSQKQDTSRLQTSNDALDDVFKNLHRWRHLPSYQFERRIDVLLSPYLHEVLANHFGPRRELSPVFVPELPLLKRGEGGRATKKLSYKVDYVFFDVAGPRVLFVEFKSDAKSLREKQDAYLQEAARRRFGDVLNDLKQILPKTKAVQKYFHLLSLLECAGRIRLKSDLREALYPKVRRGFRYGDDVFHDLYEQQPIEIVYLLPECKVVKKVSNCTYIGFNEILRVVEKRQDRFSQALHGHLTTWLCEAGSVEPESHHD